MITSDGLKVSKKDNIGNLITYVKLDARKFANDHLF